MPTSGRYLLDTNVIIVLLQGDQGAVSNIELAAEVFLPVIAVGELLFGAA
jgi:tRNA(fMet)-specific endonuclease VapC